MMKNKKLLAMLVALFSSVAVSACAFTGCGGGSDDDTDTDITDTNTGDESGSGSGSGDNSGSGSGDNSGSGSGSGDNNDGSGSGSGDNTVAVTGISLDQTTASVVAGGTVTLTATVTPSDATDSTVTWTSSDTDVATVSGGVVTGIAAGTATITATVGSYSATCTLTVTAAPVEISTADELVAFRQLGEVTGTYKLTADIDLSGYTLDDATVILTSGATFDGQGYTISNVSYSTSTAKTGILFNSITGGTVTNIRFLNCSITGTSESVAVLAGLCDGNATISKIEFNACSATTSASAGYVGIIFARNTKACTIDISEITTKNGCSTSCTQYGGFLVGDIVGSTTVNFKDLDVDGEFADSTANGAFIAGRTRAGSSVSVENAVISATVANSLPLISGNSALTDLTIKNVLVVKSNVSALYKTAPTGTTTIENLVTVSGVTVSSSTASDGADTATYLKETLGFDFDTVWTTEGDTGYRLINSSVNTKSADATITSLVVSTANAETRVKKNGSFSTDGLVVTGVYSDGVRLLLTENEGYTIEHSAVNVDTAGTYTVTVVSKEDTSVTATYSVTVVEETGFNVYDEFVTKVYVTGETLDTANLVVTSVWSDGEEETLSASEYTVDATSYSMTTANTHSVKVTYGSYEAKTISIAVIDSSAIPTETENTVTIYVAADTTGIYSYDDTSAKYTFSNVKDAIDFLEACDYDDMTVKVINIGAGTYEAKITTDLCNLTLIGENTNENGTYTDKSILTYSAVESTVDIVSGSAYGLDCATLRVNGYGFTAKNLTIRNDFDYINDAASESSPQGLALTIAGDQAIVENCHLYGNQDTLYLKNGRAYFKNTLIEGNVDFIFGEATGIAYFDTCEIRAITRYADSVTNKSNNGYVTAMRATADDKPDYGYIFYNCSFTDDGNLDDGSMSLGRPWGAKATVAMINCSFSKAYSTAAYDGSTKSRWYSMSTNSPVDADFCEYNSTGDGAITEAVAGGSILTESQAANYTLANIFAATNGKCTWDYAWSADNTIICVSIYNSEDTSTAIATIKLYTGRTLTSTAITTAANSALSSSSLEVSAIYTDSSTLNAFSDTAITAATSIYVTTTTKSATTSYTVKYTATADTSSGTAAASTNKFDVSYSGTTDTSNTITFTNNVSTLKSNQGKSTSDSSVSYTYCYEIKSNKYVTIKVGSGAEDVSLTAYVSQSTSTATRTVLIGTSTSDTSATASTVLGSLAIGGDTGASINYLYAITVKLEAGKTYYIYTNGDTCHLYDVVVTYSLTAE